jgi:thiol:disulfide interchange protein DsbD
MERLKQFMGFPLLATNLWLLWVLQNQRGELAMMMMLLLLLILGFCAWIYGVAGGRLRFPILLLALLLAIVSLIVLGKRIGESLPPSGSSSSMFSQDKEVPWIPYSQSALDELRAQGKPVFLDFTASWCLTCQFNERTAINVPAVRKVLKDRGITAMKGDWTNSDPAITAALKSFGRVGVPLAVYYPPGTGSDPIVLPELLTEKIVLEAIEK